MPKVTQQVSGSHLRPQGSSALCLNYSRRNLLSLGSHGGSLGLHAGQVPEAGWISVWVSFSRGSNPSRGREQATEPSEHHCPLRNNSVSRQSACSWVRSENSVITIANIVLTALLPSHPGPHRQGHCRPQERPTRWVNTVSIQKRFLPRP